MNKGHSAAGSVESAKSRFDFYRRSWILGCLLLALVLVSCNLPAPGNQEGQFPTRRTLQPPDLTTAAQTRAAATPTSQGPGVPLLGPAEVTQTGPSIPETAAGGAGHLAGVEVHYVTPQVLDQLDELGVSLVRRNGLVWPEVEAVEGERNWGAVAGLEEGLELLGSRGFETILIVRGTPEWAQKIPGSQCGAVKRGKFKAFAGFVAEAVARYSQPPFNVKYWELGNEPDVDPSLISPTFPFGCWGDQEDPFYGGGFYADMLKEVYPAVKVANPQVEVLIGGLLLDCDPENPPQGSDCKPGRFLEGILQAGGGDFFDIVSFHGYPPYIGSLAMDERNPAWVARGGTVLGRVAFLRAVMEAYGVNKPLMHTESALVCPQWSVDYCNPPGDDFYEAQADYAVILFVRNRALGLAGTIWYQFEGPGWRSVGLLDEAGNPKPGYRAIQFLHQELGTARYLGPVKQNPAVRGYAFSTPQKTIWVLWSLDEQPAAVILPQGVIQVIDKYGNGSVLGGDRLDVLSPVYVEFLP